MYLKEINLSRVKDGIKIEIAEIVLGIDKGKHEAVLDNYDHYSFIKFPHNRKSVKITNNGDISAYDYNRLEPIHVKNQAEAYHLLAETQWISFDKELPELEQEIIVKAYDNFITRAILEQNEGQQYETIFCLGEEISVSTNEFVGWLPAENVVS